MARCLHPRTIVNPATYDAPHMMVIDRVGRRYGRENLRPVLHDTIVVPCGKCINCLKNKQSSMVVRCKREAEQRGSFAFMTLTYDDEHLPITQSLFCREKSTGIEVCQESAEFVSTGYRPVKRYTDLFSEKIPSDSPRYHSFFVMDDGVFEYEARLTPSVCRADVRLWLKMARIQYRRDYGVPLPDFSYVAISEYGPRTCRPHYHLAFFGLRREHLYYLLDRWPMGKVKQVRIVNQVNPDGSSGFLKASKYIGKYMSKGKFECESVKCGASERPRVCQSLHLGTKQLESITQYVLCFDMIGPYDPVALMQGGLPLSKDRVDALVDEIPRRLVYRVDDRTVLPLPRIIRDKIFKLKDDEFKKKKISTPLWAMVARSLRDQFERERDEQFEQFCSMFSERTPTENAVQFAYLQECRSGIEEASMSEDMQSFYAKSHF